VPVGCVYTLGQTLCLPKYLNVSLIITIKRMHESTMHLTVEITTPVHRTICTDACGIGKVTLPGMVFGADWWIEKMQSSTVPQDGVVSAVF
jgi:hypothetical protein